MAPTVCAATCASSATRSPGRCRCPLTRRNCLPASIIPAAHPARRIRHPTLPGCSVVTVGGCLVEPDNEHDEDEPAKGAEPADDGTGDGETLAASLARTGLAEGRDAEDQSEGRQAHQGQDEAGDGETAGGHDPGLLHVVVTQGGLSRSWRFLADRHDAPAGWTHLRAHETRHDLVCRLLLEKKKNKIE